MNRKLRNYWDLLAYATLMHLRRDVSKYYLTYAWWLLEPLMQFGALFVVFGVFQRPGVPAFAGFLLCGIVVWQWFARGVTNTAGSILESVHIAGQYRVHALFFPLISLAQDMVKQLPVFVLLLFLFLIVGPGISFAWISLPLVFIAQGLMVLGAGILGAALVPFVPDLRLVIAFLLSLLFFASGIFFDIGTLVQPQYRMILYANPMAVYIQAYRTVLVYGQMPDWNLLACATSISLFILILAVALVLRFDRVYTRISME